jgi:hypothetical protein
MGWQDGRERAPQAEKDAAWSFAQENLGIRVSSGARERDYDQSAQELCDWLADIAPRQAAKRRGSEYEPRDIATREQLRVLASYSARHAEELRRLEEAEVAAERRRDWLERFWEAWDPAKHPRLGAPPNAGWFASKGGGVDSSDGIRRKDGAFEISGSAEMDLVAQNMSSGRSVGHHWAPRSVVIDPEIRPLLSDEARAYAMGSYSGPTDPSHNYGTYGGVSHRQYNQRVKEELLKFIKDRKIKKMTANQMEEFIGLINRGLGANGKIHGEIAAFNRAINAAVPKGTIVPSNVDDVIKAGNKYLKGSRFRAVIAGAIVSGVLGEVVAKQVEILQTAKDSGHYKRALQALEDGDLGKAQSLLVGERDSLYMEILLKQGAIAALRFRKAMEKAFEDANSE